MTEQGSSCDPAYLFDLDYLQSKQEPFASDLKPRP